MKKGRISVRKSSGKRSGKEGDDGGRKKSCKEEFRKVMRRGKIGCYVAVIVVQRRHDDAR